MTTWIQSLSWTLIYSLGQGLAVYTLLWLTLKLVPARWANTRYHLSLSSLTILLGWFAATWWQQYHALTFNELSYQDSVNKAATRGVSLQHIFLSDGLNRLQAFQSSLSATFPWLCLFYAAGLLVMLTRLSAGMLQLFSLRNKDTFEPSTSVHQLFEEQKTHIPVIAPVRLLISAKAQVPMVIGFIRPIVLVPIAALTQLDTEQLKAILLHELAHIRRNDYLVNILQTIAETILFFNPFVWMISTTVRREREHCCDDLVVNHTSEPMYYATALTILASRKPTAPTIAVAATGKQTDLYNRIQRIMEVKRNQFSYSRMIATLIIIAVIGCSIAWIKPSFTKTKKTKPTAAASIRSSEHPAPVAVTEVPKRGAGKAPKPATADNVKETATAPEKPEQNILIDRLLNDKLIDQVRGFLVEKRDDKLFINGELVPDVIAQKYLSGLKSKTMYLQVHRMEDRLRMHPNADLLQLLLPYSLESPCMDTKPKDGC